MSLVVFDMDGTLIDSGAEIAARVLKAFAVMGLPAPSLEAIRANVGLSLPIYLSAVSGSDDPQIIQGLFDAYRAAANASGPGKMPMFDGARALLDRLSQRPETMLAIATGKGKVGLDKTLAQNDIGHYFVSLQSADNNPSKPHPGMLHSAMEAVGAAAEETVMIGDAVFDIEMANAAGVRSIAVSWGLQPVDALRVAGATASVDSFEDLYDTIERVLEEKAHA
ncbi:HAD family hydrolase [Devosia sp. SL43]|uniref:HAD family hydrolase n=1 Tax=Devosia sp. SL43 TaxID=2806348 RepID=UPI001F028262|nr:HAD-IA family hydrolase [Devosia sp. SL43]UJW86346.1 HAD-IA family hydrolase [Devosia sp. SL43]